MAVGNLGQSETSAVKSMLQASPEELGNDASIEFHWAMKAFHHAETYFNIIKAIDPKLLKLTQVDDTIFEKFEKEFPDTSIDVINEAELKSPEGKEKWRAFCTDFQGKVEDYNMGSLLRINCLEDISDKNTTLVPRIQFLAIEIARNRRGLNDPIREKYKNSSPQES